MHQRLIHWLEDRGDLDRALEFLPTDADMAGRARDGLGLTSPEFSVLVAYAKLALKHDLLPTELPDDPWFRQTLADYFPTPMRERYAGKLAEHPLRREIVTNAVANSMVNRGGITFVFRTMEETGATPEQIARAFVVCREVFGLSSFVAAIEALDNVVPTSAQTRSTWSSGGCWTGPSGGSSPPGPRTWTSRPRSAGSDRWSPTSVRRSPSCCGEPSTSGWSAGHESSRSSAPPPTSRYGPQRCSTSTRCSTSSRSRTTPASRHRRWPASTTSSRRSSGSTRCSPASPSCPASTSWDALARGAMRDDLYSVCQSMTRSVMDAAPVDDGGTDPVSRFERWAKANHDTLARAKRSLADITRLESPNLAALSVALRTLRSVIRSGSAS